MLQMGNQAPHTRPLPGAHGGSAQGPSPLQAVLGALRVGEAVTFRRTAAELPARRPDFLTRPRLRRMVVTSTGSLVPERALIEDARRGEDHAFGRLVGPYWSELHAHCYRLLGSVHDADDALQDALLRAWRGLPGFDSRRPLRPWLYKIGPFG